MGNRQSLYDFYRVNRYFYYTIVLYACQTKRERQTENFLTFLPISTKIIQVATNRFCILQKGFSSFSTPQRGDISIEMTHKILDLQTSCFTERCQLSQHFVEQTSRLRRFLYFVEQTFNLRSPFLGTISQICGVRAQMRRASCYKMAT